jgi:hypothetical protein
MPADYLKENLVLLLLPLLMLLTLFWLFQQLMYYKQLPRLLH